MKMPKIGVLFLLALTAGFALADGLQDGALKGPWQCGRFAAVTSPETLCVGDGELFSFQVTYRSKCPLTLKLVGYAGKPLPEGLAFDAATGVLTGRLAGCGERMVTFVLADETGRTVTWGDLKIKVTPVRPQPPTLAGETFYQLQMPGFTAERNFAGVRAHLKRIAGLGVSWIYLSPVTVADRGTDRKYWSRRQRQHDNPVNPYRTADFWKVDPDYGTMDDFKALVAEAHALGLKVMTDVVFFHCGPNAVFLKDHPDWICRDAQGEPVCNEWMFPKLDLARRDLRDYLRDSLLMWVTDCGVDGFRTDCGCDVPLDFWEECVAAVEAKKRDVVWLLEGLKPEYGEKAFNVFYGFICGHNGVNAAMDELFPASVVRTKWLEEKAQGPASAYFMRGTDTHDVANNDGDRRQEARWGHARAETALALSFALDGPTMLWQGQEIGWDRPYCIFGYTHPDWEHPPVPERASVIRRLATLKKTEPAFGRDGRLVWLTPEKPDDQVLFRRVAPDGTSYRCFFDLCRGVWDISKETAPHAFSTLRLPATRENWSAQRAVLSRSRGCFDEIWFSACNFKSLAENAEKAKWLGEVAHEVRAMGYVASLEFELTIGNSDTPESERMPFKDWTGFTGPEGWEGIRCNCPRDPRFHAYFREQLKYYGAWAPTVIWLDDDVRVDNHGNNRTGCFCARCLAAFSEAEGKTWTREALVAAMTTDAALAARWRTHCFKGLGEFAHAFCRAVREFSPTSRVGFQYPWADEGQLHIVEAMVKAVGGPIEMRPGCCSYQDRNPFFQVDKTYRLQHQVKTLLAHPEWYSRLCPEIETYPRTFTTRSARSLGFEALLHLASGLDSLTWYIAGNAEPFDLYERTTFRAPGENLWLYREYVRRNEGAEPIGFDAPDGAEFPAVYGSSTIPYSFGAGRKLGTVVWLADQVKKADEKTLKAMLGGAVLASREAAAALVERRLVPADATDLPKEEYSDSTAHFPKSVKTDEGGTLVVYPRLDPMEATVKTLLEYSQRADAACGGRLPVLFEDPALAVVLPRVFADGSFASSVIVNTRIEEQAPVRLRLRNFKSDDALWFPLWSEKPERLSVTRDAKTGDALVTLPSVGAWSGGFLAP